MTTLAVFCRFIYITPSTRLGPLLTERGPKYKMILINLRCLHSLQNVKLYIEYYLYPMLLCSKCLLIDVNLAVSILVNFISNLQKK